MPTMCGSELIPKTQGLSPSDRRLHALAARVLQSQEAMPSPCISVCRMSDDNNYCAGCWRTLDEIAQWGSSSESDKRAMWALIDARLTAAEKTL